VLFKSLSFSFCYLLPLVLTNGLGVSSQFLIGALAPEEKNRAEALIIKGVNLY